MAESSFNVETYEHGLVIRGPLPVSQMLAIADGAAAQGWTLLDAGLAMALTEPGGPGVSLVLVSRASGEAWREELRATAAAEHTDPVMAWLHGPDMGSSSIAMVRALGTPEQRRIAAQRVGPFEERPHPRDPDDLGRCLGLLEVAPRWRERLDEVAKLSSAWAGLVAAWDALERLHAIEAAEGQGFPLTSAKMQEVLGGR